MPSLNFKTLQIQLSTMLANIVEPGVLDVEHYRNLRYFSGDQSSMNIYRTGIPFLGVTPNPNEPLGSSFSLVDDGWDAYENFVDGLNGDDIIKNKVGRQAIEQEIEGLLRAFKGMTPLDVAALDSAIRAALKRLKDLVKSWEAAAPVDNLELVGLEEVTIGKITFRQTASVLPPILEHTTKSIEGSSASDAVKQGMKHQIWEVSAQNFGNTKTCATLNVEAEQSRLPAIVDDHVDAALNILRCYMGLLFPHDDRNYIGLRGDVVSSWRPCLGITGEIGVWNVTARQIGGLYPYILNSEILEHLKKQCAFDALSNALAKTDPPPTEFESTLLTASRWLGRGIVATDNAEKVLNLAVALERLVCGNQRESIGDKLAQRVAILLGKTREKRQRISRQVKKLYGLRSKVVHDGLTEVGIEDVRELETVVCMVFITLAERTVEWQKSDDFHNWVEEQVFTLPDDTNPEENAQAE